MQNCSSVGKFSGIRRLEVLTRQRAVRWVGRGRIRAARMHQAGTTARARANAALELKRLFNQELSPARRSIDSPSATTAAAMRSVSEFRNMRSAISKKTPPRSIYFNRKLNGSASSASRRWNQTFNRNNGPARRSTQPDELANLAVNISKAPAHSQVRRQPHPQHAPAK
jgi:hypothetical protein